MPNPPETDTGSNPSGQQGQAQPGQPPQPPAWFSDPQQQAIFANYQKLGFDGHILHAMNQFAQSPQNPNKAVAGHLQEVFGSLPDLEMTAWLDAQQTQKDRATQQVTVLQKAVTAPPGTAAPPPNPQQAQAKQLAQGQIDQLHAVVRQQPHQALTHEKARYAMMAKQDPIDQEFLRNAVTAKPGTFAQPASDVTPLSQLPAAVQKRLLALAEKKGVSVFGIGGQDSWSPELQSRMQQLAEQAKTEHESRYSDKDRASIKSVQEK